MKNSWLLRTMAWALGLLAILTPGMMSAAAADPGASAERTRQLAAVLRSQAPLFEKARACQQLGEIGDGEAVPALAELLPDEHLSAYARSGPRGDSRIRAPPRPCGPPWARSKAASSRVLSTPSAC